jgi:hypothetical protein
MITTSKINNNFKNNIIIGKSSFLYYDYNVDLDIKSNINNYFSNILNKLDPVFIYNFFNNKNIVSEDIFNNFSLRHVIADYLELFLGVDIYEIDNSNNILDRPEYIRDYLILAIKNNREMYGFTSIRALYLYENSLKYDSVSDILERENINTSKFRRFSYDLKIKAELIERDNLDKIKSK